MIRKIAGLGLALGLTFAGLTAAPAKAVEEVRAERTSTVLTENAASADAGEKENEEVVAQAAIPQALGSEGEAAAPVAVNNVVPFERVRRHSNAPSGAKLVVAGRLATKEVAHDSRSERLNSRVDISVHDDFWEALRQQRVAEQEKGAQQQEEQAPSPTSSEVKPAPQVEKLEAQPNAPPSQEGNQAETDSATSGREMVGVEHEPSTDVEGEAQNQEEPASPAIDVELGEEVIELSEEPTSSPDKDELESMEQEKQEEVDTNLDSNSVTESDNSTDKDAQVEASESVVEENEKVVQEKVDEVSGGNADLEETVSEDESGSASLESQEKPEVQETSNNEASEAGKAGVDLEETVPTDSSEIDDGPLESIEQAETEEVAPTEGSASLGFTKIGDEEETPTFDVGIDVVSVENDFGVETTIKTPVGGGEEDEIAVDVKTALPLSETTSISLEAEDLLSAKSTIKANLDIQALSNLVVSPGVEKSSNEALKYNLSAALQATESLILELDIKDVAAEPVFDVKSKLTLGERELVATIKDVSAVEARTFDLEGSFQIVEWARACVKFESIFNSPVVGLGTDIQLTRSTELSVGVNDAFGSQTYDAKIKYTFGL